ncbi:MAG: GNAT family N-acetyltransferase [Chloroflexota bacterium]|nr:GNAT family N-acetyltransferase [Chloroflexota bacterium]
MSEPVVLRPLTSDDAPACDAIIASLPYFFGDPQGVRDCAGAARTQSGIVALAGEAIVGFLTIERFGPGSAEVTWMAVHASHRRGGIGRMLIDRTAAEMTAAGARVLFVLTLGPSVPEPEVADNYAGTRAFYETMGFIPLREFALATWNDPAALILVRPLTPRALP